MDMAQTWRTKVAQKIIHAASRHSYLSLIFEAHGQHAEIELPCQGLRSWPSGILQAGCIKGVMAIPSWFKIQPNGTWFWAPCSMGIVERDLWSRKSTLTLGSSGCEAIFVHIGYRQVTWDLWWFMMIYDDLWWFMMFYDDVWWFMMIYVGRGSPTIIFLGISNMKDITDMPSPALKGPRAMTIWPFGDRLTLWTRWTRWTSVSPVSAKKS